VRLSPLYEIETFSWSPKSAALGVKLDWFPSWVQAPFLNTSHE
jgi:hypothetical protein